MYGWLAWIITWTGAIVAAVLCIPPKDISSLARLFHSEGCDDYLLHPCTVTSALLVHNWCRASRWMHACMHACTSRSCNQGRHWSDLCEVPWRLWCQTKQSAAHETTSVMTGWKNECVIWWTSSVGLSFLLFDSCYFRFQMTFTVHPAVIQSCCLSMSYLTRWQCNANGIRWA
jgi:hypothetical protein